MVKELKANTDKWLNLTIQIGSAAMKTPDNLGSGSVDYLMFSGYTTLAYFWAKMAKAASDKEKQSPFTKAKLQTAKFYFDRILPRNISLEKTMLAGADTVMPMDEEAFVI